MESVDDEAVPLRRASYSHRRSPTGQRPGTRRFSLEEERWMNPFAAPLWTKRSWRKELRVSAAAIGGGCAAGPLSIRRRTPVPRTLFFEAWSSKKHVWQSFGPDAFVIWGSRAGIRAREA